MGEPNVNSRCPLPKPGESLWTITPEPWSASAPLWHRADWKTAGVWGLGWQGGRGGRGGLGPTQDFGLLESAGVRERLRWTSDCSGPPKPVNINED